MTLEDTVDDERMPFADRYREALGQTISEEEFSAQAIQTLAEDWGAEDNNERVQGVMFNLLETIEDSVHENEVDFRLASSEVGMEGEALGEDPFEEQGGNRYVIKGMLGSGGMGQVFEVLDTSFDRTVAVKFLHPKAAAAPKKMNDFFKEARLTARLEHPNIFPVHDVNISDGGMPYFSMRKADGDSLHELIEQSKPPHAVEEPIQSFSDRANIIIKVCDAVAYAHGQGIIHQDIKPSNIMIGEFGEVVVVDWGTARDLSVETEGRPKMQGTPIYMSPEQARREFSTILSDVYCIGATLFHLLTFRFPTWSDDPDAFWEIKKQGIISMPTDEEQREIPGALLSIALKAMAVDPADRYQSVLEMRDDLIRYQRGYKVLAHRDTPLDMLVRIYRLNKRAVWAALVVALLLLGLSYSIYQEVMKSQSEWKLVDSFDFDQTTLDDLEADWDAHRYYAFKEETVELIPLDQKSAWSIKEGRLVASSKGLNANFNLTYGHHIAGDIRVEWDYTPIKGTRSINCYIGAAHRFGAYHFHLGGQGSSAYKYMTRQELFVEQNENWAYEEGQTYHYRMEKEGQYVRLFINDELNFEYRDIDVLGGPGHQTFGFETLHGIQAIDNVKIYSRPLPQKISPIMVANSLYSNRRYADAVDHYLDIQRAYPDSDLDALATFRKGRSYLALGQYDEALLSFNDFRHRFPDHGMTGYVLRDMGLTYVAKDKWELAVRYFDEIADHYKSEQSLRRSTFQAIEAAMWNILNLNDQSYLLEENVMEKVNRIERLINHWSERLDVNVARYNNIMCYLPFAMIAYGDFERPLKDEYSNKYWPWPARTIYRINGDYKQGLSFEYNVVEHTDSGHVKGYLERLGRTEEIHEKWGVSNFQKAVDYLDSGQLEKARELYPDPSHIFYAKYLIKRGMYQRVLDEFPQRDAEVIKALLGLKRYDKVTAQRFPDHLYQVEIASILQGHHDQIIEDPSNACTPYYIEAVAYGLLLAAEENDQASFTYYYKLMNDAPFFINNRNVENTAFEKFFLPAFLAELRGDKGAVNRSLQIIALTEKWQQIALLRAGSNVLRGKAVEPGANHFIGSELSPALFQAMHAELQGQPQRASELYQKALELNRPHNRTVPGLFAEWRHRVLSADRD